MLGGEGNAYGNVFQNIEYFNFENKPVDFDFHGCSETPFSPPSWNLFENVDGFRGIKGAGSYFHQPPCGVNNVWWNIYSLGLVSKEDLFYHGQYAVYGFLRLFLGAIYKTAITLLQKNVLSYLECYDIFIKKYMEIKSKGIKKENHYKLFKGSIIIGYFSEENFFNKSITETYINDDIFVYDLKGEIIYPLSLYEYQLNNRIKRGMNEY